MTNIDDINLSEWNDLSDEDKAATLFESAGLTDERMAEIAAHYRCAVDEGVARELTEAMEFMKDQLQEELVDQLDRYLHECFGELLERLDTLEEVNDRITDALLAVTDLMDTPTREKFIQRVAANARATASDRGDFRNNEDVPDNEAAANRASLAPGQGRNGTGQTKLGESLEEGPSPAVDPRIQKYVDLAEIGPGGLAQVVFFRGADELQATQWLPNAESLARAIAKVEHRGGWTQHNRALAHVIREAEKHPIDEVVVISDAFEQRREHRPDGDILDDAIDQAAQLRALGVNISIGYKGTVPGGCPLDRAGPSAEEAFYRIAKANGGKCFVFNPKKAGAAAKRFGEIAAHAALKVKGDTSGAQAMLEHLHSVPFDMGAAVVDDVVPLRRCERRE